MKLFTKQIEKELQRQYTLGNDLEKQNVICKIFNPYGIGTWYIINQDPKDTNYLWCIAHLFEWEIGSISKIELEETGTSVNVLGLGHPVIFPLERDLCFKRINAAELWKSLTKK